MPGFGHPAFEQLVERTSDYVIVTVEGRVAHANPALLAGLGYSREELIGMVPLELAHPDDRDGVRTRIANAVRGAVNAEPTRVRLRRRDGSWTSIEGHSFTIELDGKPGAMLIGHDLTPREDLRRTAAEFRRLVDTLPIAVMIRSGDEILYVNEGLAQIAEKPVRELIGGAVSQFVPPSMEAEMRFWNEKLDGTLDPLPTMERTLQKPDGTPVVLQLSGIGVRYEGRDARLVAAVDVTARHAAERRLRTLLDSAPLAICSLDTQARILSWNRGAEVLFAWPPVDQSPVPRPVPPETQQRVAALCATAAKTGFAEADRELVRSVDGKRVAVRSSVAPLRDPEGRIEGYVLVTSDVTAAYELRRTEAMSAMGALVAGVAHEVRNPLFGMTATLDAMHQRFGSDPAQEQFLAALRRELDRINALMRDLLEYGRPPAVTLVPDPLLPVIALAARSCTPVADMAGVEIENAVEPAAGSVAMDAGRLAQVFQNLIENAIQHSPRGAKIRVEATRSAAQVEVRVLDSGPGFRPADLPLVFQPFFTRRRGGTGLGLSIVQRIVEQHNGTVKAANRPEGGACVTVTLPV